jgi:hypothetical protein
MLTNKLTKSIGLALMAPALFILTIGCANMTPQQAALVTNAVKLADVAAMAAANIYGGPEAGHLASAGLSALGSVLQGYVGAQVPAAVLKASPGVAGVGEALAQQIAPNRVISQRDVNAVHRAAAIAATLKAVDLVAIPAAAGAKTGG